MTTSGFPQRHRRDGVGDDWGLVTHAADVIIVCILKTQRDSLAPPRRALGKAGHELVDLVLLLLHDALADPDQVPYFLFFQLDVRVVDPEVHLALEGQFEHAHFPLIERVIYATIVHAFVDVGCIDLAVHGVPVYGIS